MQITGKAAIIELISAEYVAHAEYKKVPVTALQKLFNQGRSMHLICITPVKMDVLFSDFKKQGYDVRQVLEHTGK